MANWCENRLTITGETDSLQRFINAFGDSPDETFKMKNLVPFSMLWGTPDEMECENGIAEQLLAANNKEVVFEYETKFNPNDKFVKSVSELYPDLNFKLEYYEPGAGYVGVIHFKDNCKVDSREVIRHKDLSNEEEYFDLLIDLGFDDITYIISSLVSKQSTIDHIKEKFLNQSIIIDIRDKVKDRSDMPEVE